MTFNRLKTFLLLGVLSGLVLSAGYLMSGRSGLIIAFIIALGINFFSYFFSDKIVLKIYRAKEANLSEHRRLYSLVREVSQFSKIPLPKIYIVRNPSPNAFATGRNPKNAAIAFTDGILGLLNDTELKGVIAHEMSHIKNRDILIQTIAVTIATTISFIASMAKWAAIFGGFRDEREGSNIFVILALAILTPVVATILQLSISRSREYLADETAAKTLHNGLGLAQALEKLDEGISKKPMKNTNATTASLFIANPFSSKGFFALFSTHPPLKERIKKLRSMRF